MVNYLNWTWVSIAGFAFSLSFFFFFFFFFFPHLFFSWELQCCENVCISRWQGKKENKPQPFLYTKLQGGWQNLSLNVLWCCSFERRGPSPALWSGFPAYMPLQMLLCIVLPPSFSVSFYFCPLCHGWDPPVAVACPPGSLQHDQYEVESESVDCILVCMHCKRASHYG